MRLTDRLQPLDAAGEHLGDPLRAHVGTSAAKLEPAASQTFPVMLLSEEIRALIRPHPHAAPGALWEWRGQRYRQPTSPIVRRRNGRDHHYTLRLEAIGEGVQ